MSLADLRPSLRALPRRDKFLLVQELIAELAQEEGVTEIEYLVWSPYDAHDAAATLGNYWNGRIERTMNGQQNTADAFIEPALGFMTGPR